MLDSDWSLVGWLCMDFSWIGRSEKVEKSVAKTISKIHNKLHRIVKIRGASENRLKGRDGGGIKMWSVSVTGWKFMVKYSSFDSPKILSSVNNDDDDDVGYDDKKLILERTQFLLALVMSQMLSTEKLQKIGIRIMTKFWSAKCFSVSNSLHEHFQFQNQQQNFVAVWVKKKSEETVVGSMKFDFFPLEAQLVDESVVYLWFCVCSAAITYFLYRTRGELTNIDEYS